MEMENNYLNQLKVLSIILISIYCISKTCYDIHSAHNLTYVTTRLVSNLGFPILLMVFGALFINIKSEAFTCLKKAYKLFIPPFIIWNIILAILLLKFNGTNLFVTSLSEYNWFAWVLLCNFLLIPILTEFIKFEKESGMKYILALFFISSILWSLSIQFDFKLYFIDLVFFAEPFCFMVLGYYLANKDFKLSSTNLFIISSVIFIAVLALRWLLIFNGYNEYYSFFIFIFKTTKLKLSLDPFCLIEVSALFLMFKTVIGKFLSNSKIIKFYSGITFSSLLTLSIFCLLISQFAFTQNWIYITVIAVTLFIIVNGIILFIIGKIPLLKKIVA